MSNTLLRTAASAVIGCIAALGSLHQPAHAAPTFQMPFPCGQTWTSATYTGHNPQRASDLNRGSGGWDDYGDTVVASAAGTVKSSYYSTTTGYGHYIVIDHGGGWTTHYAHLKTRSVAAGKKVSAGQKIGEVGNSSAKYDLIPHLHYEQRLNNAVQYISWNGARILYWGHKSYKSNNKCGGSGGAPGTVNTSQGGPLNVRSGPGTSYSVVGSKNDGASVTIYCQKRGETITGTYGTSNLWNKISKSANQYIPDVYTYTGSDGQVAPSC